MEEGKEEVRERHTHTQIQTVRDGDRERKTVRVRKSVCMYMGACLIEMCMCPCLIEAPDRGDRGEKKA